MPWKEFKIMDQREQFVLDYLTGAYPKGCLVCGVWHQPADRGQVAGAVPRARGGGPRGSGPAAPHAAAPDAGRAGGGNCGDEAPASEFWAEEDSRPVTGSRLRGGVAGG